MTLRRVAEAHARRINITRQPNTHRLHPSVQLHLCLYCRVGRTLENRSVRCAALAFEIGELLVASKHVHDTGATVIFGILRDGFLCSLLSPSSSPSSSFTSPQSLPGRSDDLDGSDCLAHLSPRHATVPWHPQVLWLVDLRDEAD